MNSHIIIDRYGTRYKATYSHDSRVPYCLKLRRLHNTQSARQFVRGLRVPHGFWARLLSSIIIPQKPQGASHSGWVNAAAWALIHDKIRLYEVPQYDVNTFQPSKRLFVTPLGVTYRFEPATQLLTTQLREIKSFNGTQAATSFIDTLSLDETRLIEVLNALPCISKSEYPQTNSYGALTEFLAEKLISGTIVVFVEKASQKTILSSSTEELIHSGSSLKPVPLAPPSEQNTNSAAPSKETKSQDEKKVSNEQKINTILNRYPSEEHEQVLEILQVKTQYANLDAIDSIVEKITANGPVTILMEPESRFADFLEYMKAKSDGEPYESLEFSRTPSESTRNVLLLDQDTLDNINAPGAKDIRSQIHQGKVDLLYPMGLLDSVTPITPFNFSSDVNSNFVSEVDQLLQSTRKGLSEAISVPDVQHQTLNSLLPDGLSTKLIVLPSNDKEASAQGVLTNLDTIGFETDQIPELLSNLNLNEKERLKATKILSTAQIYTPIKLANLMGPMHDKMIDKLDNTEPVFIIPIKAKSHNLVTAMFTQKFGYKNSQIIRVDNAQALLDSSAIKALDPDKQSLVVLDDFAGSGQSLEEILLGKKVKDSDERHTGLRDVWEGKVVFAPLISTAASDALLAGINDSQMSCLPGARATGFLETDEYQNSSKKEQGEYLDASDGWGWHPKGKEPIGCNVALFYMSPNNNCRLFVQTIAPKVVHNKAAIKADSPKDFHGPKRSIGYHFPDKPVLVSTLQKFHEGSKSGLSKNMDDREAREIMLKRIEKLDSYGEIPINTMQNQVTEYKEVINQLFSETKSYNNLNVLKEELLESNPVLFSTTENPSRIQQDALKEYEEELKKANIVLKTSLQEIGGTEKYLNVFTRFKDQKGIVDKLDRMRNGNKGRASRSDYVLADMPDALGGRLIVGTVQDLPEALEKISSQFGKENIYEIDNFYTSDKKSKGPYRVITLCVALEVDSGNRIPTEIQITTLNSSITADLEHDIIYKDVVKTEPAEKETAANLFRAAVICDLDELP